MSISSGGAIFNLPATTSFLSHRRQRASVGNSVVAPMGGGQGPRGDFAVLTDADLNAFRHILGADNVRTDAKSLDAANEDWMRKYRGDSRVLLLPRSTDQVSDILRHCNTRGLAVVPQGGNTGLVGGGVPVHDEIVIGLKHMDKVLGEFILCYVRAIRLRAIRVGN